MICVKQVAKIFFSFHSIVQVLIVKKIQKIKLFNSCRLKGFLFLSSVLSGLPLLKGSLIMIGFQSQEPEVNINPHVQVVSSSSNGHQVPVECKVYWYRWYICIIFGLMGLLQGAIWNTWSPIDESSETAFGFSSCM